MNEVLLTAIVGSLSGFFASFISVYFAYKSIKSDYRGKFELEIISKQINACETLWSILSVASKSEGEDRILTHKNDQITLDAQGAKKLYDALNQIFNSPMGLYFSRALRKSLFELRDFIYSEFLQKATKENHISNTKAAKFDGYIQNLRVAIRREIGVVDLSVTMKGPLD